MAMKAAAAAAWGRPKVWRTKGQATPSSVSGNPRLMKPR